MKKLSKRDLIEEMIREHEYGLMRTEIMEQFFSRQSVLPQGKSYEHLLGKTQAELSEQKKLKAFLEEIKKDLDKEEKK